MTSHGHTFKAEVQQLLDLMIHSLYSDREIFLRELVSNAADALDRARFLSLTRDDLAPLAGEQPQIRITVDAEANTVVIEDDGIGLTEAEAIENLGTIAHSGTKAFLAALEDAADEPSFIGQFGVGFYSAFMVADEVTVESCSALPDEAPITWKSEGKGTYDLEAGDRAVRGTKITVKLREDAAEFADPARLRSIIKHYSNFLPWPILVDGEQANQAKALWLEPPSAVSDEEAREFYQELTLDWREPALVVHGSADSPIQYSALLFVPSEAPYDLWQPEAERGPRLYARRVLISEHARDLLPDWLRFLRGVVSSEDIALNVSREMVQKTPVVRRIRKAIVKRVLKDLGALAEQEAPEDGPHPYDAIWHAYGMLLKEGYFHDEPYRDLLLRLLRFNAVSHDDGEGLMSLAEYKAAMPEGQDTIWYLAGPSRQICLRSPHLEAIEQKGWDVLLLTDPVDEWFVSALTEYEGIPLKAASRGEIDLDEEEDEAEEGERADITGLAPWLQELYGEEVAGVRPSGRLTDSPCVLVDDEAGVSANMERLLKAARQEGVPSARRFLELNPKHPLIRHLATLHERGKQQVAEPIARLLLDEALLMEGVVKDPTATGRRLQELLEQAASSALAES